MIVYAAINLGHNAAFDSLFEESGPWGLLKAYGTPCINQGAQKVLVRQLATPWDWLWSLSEAGHKHLGRGKIVLYTNPRAGLFTWPRVELLSRWCYKTQNTIVLEGSGLGAPTAPGADRSDADYCWTREALAAAGALEGVEPGIDRNDPWAQKYRPYVEDEELVEGMAEPGGWFGYQIPPWESPAGWASWYRHGLRWPDLSVPDGVAAHRAYCESAPGCKIQVVAADLIRDYGLQV